MGEVYSKKVLAGTTGQRTYSGENLEQLTFPLGGLGAGCIHLGGSGNFQDFCLFHQPSFGHSPMTFAEGYRIAALNGLNKLKGGGLSRWS